MTAARKVSVCVPMYNGEPHLEECLESVAAQTLSDFELLLVDEGSTGDTLDISACPTREALRVRVKRNARNLGQVGNWARCVDLARGQWVKVVFQDDLLDRDCIATLLGEGEGTGCPLVFCRRRYPFEVGTPHALRQYHQDCVLLSEEHFPACGFVPPRAFASVILALSSPDTNFMGESISVLFKTRLIQEFGAFIPLLVVSCDSEIWHVDAGGLKYNAAEVSRFCSDITANKLSIKD